MDYIHQGERIKFLENNLFLHKSNVHFSWACFFSLQPKIGLSIISLTKPEFWLKQIKMFKTNLTVLAIIFLSVLTISSCGDAEAKKEGPKTAPTEAPKKAEAPTDNAVTNLELSGSDAMQYDKTELIVKAGSKVKLTFKHTGKMPVTAMGHNFVLLKLGTDIADFASKAIAAKDNDYIPESDAIIVHTKMIGGGESVEITFDAPAKGTYDYICSFPGHYGVMKGKFIVE